jgi:formate dehydrogenase subunit delta
MHSPDDHLVTMGNQISEFFQSMKNRDEALEQIANHIRLFWDPRMRRSLLALMPEDGPAPAHMSAVLAEALRRHGARLA